MDLINNITDQKAYLEENLNKIEIVLSAIVGLDICLELREHTYGKRTYFELIYNADLLPESGIFKRCFREIRLHSSDIWFFEEGCTIQFEYHFELQSFGSNGIDVCRLSIDGNSVFLND